MADSTSGMSATTQAMIALVITSGALGTGIVAIALFGDNENQIQTITLLASALSPVVISLVGFLVAKRIGETDKRVQDLKITVDGRLSELLERTAALAHAEGRAAEQEVGRERAAQVSRDTAIITAEVAAEQQAEAEARIPNGER